MLHENLANRNWQWHCCADYGDGIDSREPEQEPWNRPEDPMDSPYKPKSPTAKNRTIIAVAITAAVIVFLSLMAGIFFLVFGVLDKVEQQENYQLAYTYLIESDAYAKLQAEESQIMFTGYSSTMYMAGGDWHASNEAVFTFIVQGVSFEITCHREGDTWYVCEDCTLFR